MPRVVAQIQNRCVGLLEVQDFSIGSLKAGTGVGTALTGFGFGFGAVVLNAIPEFLRALREWLELIPVAWTNFYPMNRAYEFLHGFLDFENAKRLIAYGVILILMMIIRPDGLLTRDSLRRLKLPRWKLRHA